ncbi:ferritin-like domain-containing protein [Lutibacter citreus]|uniref:ferritin-like domain-containing protein n=1 Tax=Lutibacter citreus TaxID=2138210 RepID=UPI000DBE3A4B|nr:PA2169 family four-helix-bundle protein [Lutibacter citreus]
MDNYKKEVSEQLNGLLKKNNDAEKGYRTAAENATSENLKAYFNKKANDRKVFGKQLAAEIATFGYVPEESGSFKGKAHRAWMNAKAFVLPDNDEAMLEEAIKGEKASLEEYNEILIYSNLHFPKSTTKILKIQRDTIFNDKNVIKALELIK